MFTSVWAERLDRFDPYAIQRLGFYKACFTAVVMVYLYWLIHPSYFVGLVAPLILAGRYESTVLVSNQERDRYMAFIYLSLIACSLSFYLIYPFRYLFFIYALIFIAINYVLISRYYPKIKNASMLMIAISSVSLNIHPPANKEAAYALFFALSMSLGIVYVCLKLFPNHYFVIWKRGIIRYTDCLIADIHALIAQGPRQDIEQEVAHINIMRSYMRKLPQAMLRPAYSLYVNVRNIHFALNLDQAQSADFWRQIEAALLQFVTDLRAGRPTTESKSLQAETELHYQVLRHLRLATQHWNQLCTISRH